MKKNRNKIQQIAVKAFIRRGNKILLVKDVILNKWDLPGGRVNFGENIGETLERELREELGAVIKFISEMPKMVYSFISMKGSHIIALGYEVRLEKEEIRLNQENTDYGYFNLEEVRELPLCSHGPFIIKYLKNISG